jgi:hypothetical protein
MYAECAAGSYMGSKNVLCGFKEECSPKSNTKIIVKKTTATRADERGVCFFARAEFHSILYRSTYLYKYATRRVFHRYYINKAGERDLGLIQQCRAILISSLRANT